MNIFKHWVVAFGLLGAVLGIALASVVSYQTPAPSVEEPHYHAGFQVYVNDELQDFSGLEFMKLTPCSESSRGDSSPAAEQLDKAHLHDANGDVAHMHRDGVTWGDLFTNMYYTFPTDTRVAYLNGQLLTTDVMTERIVADDSLVILVGTNTDVPSKLDKRVALERIREVEGLSEDCGTDHR